MKKSLIFTAMLCLSAVSYAIPIEQRALSTAVTPETNTAQQGQQLWENKQEIQKLQTQVRQLLGKLEEQEHRLDELNKELQNRYTDLDQRFEILAEQVNGPEDQPEADTDQTETPASSSTSTTLPTVNNLKEATDQVAYNAAYEAYQAGGATKAIPLMVKFIDSHPNSPYISHAHFWLGEFNLQLSPPKIHEARDNFEVVVGNYPQSAKAPTALYRLIEIAMKVDQDKLKARSLYQQLIQKYPNSSETKSARSSFGL